MMRLLFVVLAAGLWLVGMVCVWCLCVAARRGDQQAERLRHEYVRDKDQQ